MGDNITRPEHYCEGRKYEPKDVIWDWGLNFNLGSAVKYISRAGRKGDKLEDLQKAKQFLEFEIEAEEKGTVSSYATFSDEYVNSNIDAFVRAVLDGNLDIDDNFESDEIREKIINRIVERINNDELDCFDIPGNLYRAYQDIRDAVARQALHKVGEAEREDLKHIVQKIDRGEIDCNVIPSELYSSYKDIRDAVERRTSWYTNGVLGHWYYYQNIPDGYKDRVINKIAQEVLDNQCDIENDISSDELREDVIDRIVERIVNGELSSLDIPWRLFEYSRRIRNAVNLKYRDDPPFTVRDTVTITFNFEKED